MDKNNMDHDLSDIMKEIEALEQDFRNEEKAFAKSPIIQELAQLNEELSAPVGHKTQAPVDETFDWLQGDNNKEEPLEVSEADIFEMKAAPAQAAPAPAEVSTPVANAAVTPITKAKVQAPKKEWTQAASTHTSKMIFNFPEGMPVNAQFHRGQECLNFSWTEEGFHVEVEGGMSFTIPFSHYNKKAS